MQTLQQVLRDKFVCGLNSSAIQKRLLAENELTLKRALEIAQSMEAAAKQVEYLSLGNPAAAAASDHVDVNFIKSKTQSNFGNRPRFARGQKNTYIAPGRIQQQRPCFRCGNKDHMPQICRFKNQYCRVCKNKGHISTVYKKKNIPAEQIVKVVDHTVGETISSDQVDEIVGFEVYKMNTDSQAPPILFPVKLNDSNIYLELDTGASVTVISEQSWKETLKSVPLQATNVVLKTYSAEMLDVLGKASVTVEYKNQVAGLPVYALKGKEPNLMGRNWLGHINLDC